MGKKRSRKPVTRRSEEEVCGWWASWRRKVPPMSQHLRGSSPQSGGQDDMWGGEAASSPVPLQWALVQNGHGSSVHQCGYTWVQLTDPLVAGSSDCHHC